MSNPPGMPGPPPLGLNIDKCIKASYLALHHPLNLIVIKDFIFYVKITSGKTLSVKITSAVLSA
jgi:hypothetical protein